jgi:hypothetical protein
MIAGSESVENRSTPVGLPTTSGSSRRRTHPSTIVAATLTVALLVLATILVLNHGTLPLGQSPGSPGNPVFVFIDGIHRVLTYKGSWGGYFGPGVNDSCAYCPVGSQAGAAVWIPLATWYPPQNLSFWIFTNVSGPFPVLGPSCSPAPCVIPWLKVWGFETYVQAGALQSMTLSAAFLLPNQPTGSLNIIDLNATLCPASICPPPPT